MKEKIKTEYERRLESEVYEKDGDIRLFEFLIILLVIFLIIQRALCD